MPFVIREKTPDIVDHLLDLASSGEEGAEDQLYETVVSLYDQHLDSVIYSASEKADGDTLETLIRIADAAAYTPNDLLYDSEDESKVISFESFAIPLAFILPLNQTEEDIKRVASVKTGKFAEIFTRLLPVKEGQRLVFDSILYHPADVLDVAPSGIRDYFRGYADKIVATQNRMVLNTITPLTGNEISGGLPLNSEIVTPRLLIGAVIGIDNEEQSPTDTLFSPEAQAKIMAVTELISEDIISQMKDKGVSVLAVAGLVPLMEGPWATIQEVRGLGLAAATREASFERGGFLDPVFEIVYPDEVNTYPVRTQVVLKDGDEVVLVQPVLSYPNMEEPEAFVTSIRDAILDGAGGETGMVVCVDDKPKAKPSGKVLLFPGRAPGNA